MGVDVVDDGAGATALRDIFESIKGALDYATLFERDVRIQTYNSQICRDRPRSWKIGASCSKDARINIDEATLDVKKKRGGVRVFYKV